MNRNLRWSALLACMACGPVTAQGLPDPTRPPAGVEVAGGPADPAAPPAGLQSIVRRQGGKSGAVINGIYVELGGKVGEATLARIGEDSVDLRSATGMETMYLTPGVGKKTVSTESSVAKRPRGKLEKVKP